MSSAGNTGGGEMAGNSALNYYCYGCQSTVSLTNSELSCPNCNGTFVEESPSPDPVTRANPDSSFPSPPIPVTEATMKFLHSSKVVSADH